MAALQSALRLAAKGHRVFPCKNFPDDPERNKKPYVRWDREATTDPSEQRATVWKVPPAISTYLSPGGRAGTLHWPLKL